MGSDLYDVSVERWSEGDAAAMGASAARCGLDARGVEAIISRMGAGDRAVEVDIYIRQIHPDASIWCIDHGFLTMVMHDAGWEEARLLRLQELIAEHFGGFDNINSYDFAAGPDDACFAFSVLERGSAPINWGPHDEVVPDAPDDDWARVRLWMAWELGRELEGASWSSRAWAPAQQAMWLNHMPAAATPRLGEPRWLEVEQRDIRAVAMARGRVFCVGEDDPSVVCHEVDASDYLWRSDALMGGEVDGEAISVSADGERLYVAARGWAARGRVDGDGEEAEALPAGTRFALVEDCEGRLFELQTYNEEEEPFGGAVWERDRETGARTQLVAALRVGEDWPELSCYAFARSAPIGAAASLHEQPEAVIWERGAVVRRLSLAAHKLALSPHGETLYALCSAGDEGMRVEAWDVLSGQRSWSAPLLRWDRGIGDLIVLPGGATLALVQSGRLTLFDVERRCELRSLPVTPEAPRSFAHGVGVSVEGDHLFAVANQLAVRVWPLG